jgi:hypothetical protein
MKEGLIDRSLGEELPSEPSIGGSGMSIIIVMEDQIIAEQIDVIVVGDRKYEFMALMLER